MQMSCNNPYTNSDDAIIFAHRGEERGEEGEGVKGVKGGGREGERRGGRAYS